MKISIDTLLAFPLSFRAIGLTLPYDETTVASALRPGEFLAFQNAWYRVREDDGFLSWVGKASFSSTAQASHLTDEQIREEVEAIFDTTLDSRLSVCEIQAQGVMVTPMRQGLWKPGTDWQEGDYFQLNDNLYRVQHNGKLKGIGKNPYFNSSDDSASFEDFAKGFTKVTGQDISDGISLMDNMATKGQVLDSEEKIKRFFESLPLSEKQRFLAECEQVCEPYLSRQRTHD